jgi:hypothetical protein
MADNALIVGVILDGLIEAISAAWSPGLIIDDEKARTKWGGGTSQLPPLPAGGAVTLSWEDVEIREGVFNASVIETNHRYEFQIVYYFAMPGPTGVVDTILSRQKANYASLFIAQVQASSTFAGVVNNPIVDKVSAKEKQPYWEGASMVSLRFCCQAGVSFFSG